MIFEQRSGRFQTSTVRSRLKYENIHIHAQQIEFLTDHIVHQLKILIYQVKKTKTNVERNIESLG